MISEETQRLIEEEKKNQEAIQNEMVNQVIDMEKPIRYDECYSWQLKKDPYYQIQDICVKML